MATTGFAVERSNNLLFSGPTLFKNSGTPEHAASYGYDTAGRLKHVHPGYPQPTSPSTPDFTYNYESESYSLVETLTSPAHTVTNSWETTRNTLSLKENEVGSTLISSYSYVVNQIGQRDSVDVDGTAFSGGHRDRSWTYDDFGQLETEADANNAAYDRGFAYDAIGNRTASIAGDTDPTEPGAISYTPDSLNQYDWIGAFSPSHDDDGNAEDWQIRTGGLGATALSSAILIWDAENRLVEIQDSSENTIAEYSYDAQSRRIRRKITGGADIGYIYDGWNPIAEYDLSTTTPSLMVSNLWGLDLSGSMQGAGGVGGLLSVTSASGTYYPTYDGNGNVSEYLKVTTEDDPETLSVDERVVETTAHYEYDAFGNVLNFTESSSGLASTFRHRFSTKQQDDESGLLYYGYRYYDPVTGRWPSRDPIGEEGGVNLYGFVGNDGVNQWDRLGLSEGPETGEPMPGQPDSGNYQGQCTATNCVGDALGEGSLQPQNPYQLHQIMSSKGCYKVAEPECGQGGRLVIAYYLLNSDEDQSRGMGGVKPGARLNETLHVISQECGKKTFRQVQGDGTRIDEGVPELDGITSPDKAAMEYYSGLRPYGEIIKMLKLEKWYFCCPCKKPEGKCDYEESETHDTDYTR